MISDNFDQMDNSITLPPLKGDKSSSDHSESTPSKKRSCSGLLFSPTHINAARITREANNLFQRLKNAEKNITELRSEIPHNISSILEDLEKASKTIKNNSNINQNIEYKFSNRSNIAQQLNILETELKNDTQIQFLNYNETINQKIEMIHKKIQKTRTKQENQSNTHISHIDELLNDVQKREQAIINDLEKKLDKLKKYIQPIENISSYSELINSNELQIKELQIKLTSISNQLDTQMKLKPKKINNPIINQSNDTSNDDVLEVQSYLDNIYNEMNQFKKSYKEALLLLYDKAKKCELKINEIEIVTDNLSSSVKNLESKIEMEEMLIHNLFQKMEDLNQRTKNETECKYLKMLAEQIKSNSSNLHSIIASIREKLKKCEMTVPLILPD